MIDLAIEPLAEDALLLRFGNGIDAATNARVHAAARALREARLPGITDIAPAYATLLVRFDPFAWTGAGDALAFTRVAQAAESALGNMGSGSRHAAPHRNPLPEAGQPPRGADPGTRPHRLPGTSPVDRGFAPECDPGERTATCPVVEIPVCYGGEFGPDLADVAGHAHLMPGEAIARHAAAEYTVAMLGFAPGFPYLLGLDPALATPRRADPRTRVPPGSVAIGGAQTGIYPRELPGGWRLIGRTPLVLFDPVRDPPCLLAPGDRVRFRPIDAGGFARLAVGAD